MLLARPLILIWAVAASVWAVTAAHDIDLGAVPAEAASASGAQAADQVCAAGQVCAPAPAEKSPSIELLYTLVVTGTAVGIGSLAVQLGVVDLGRGDMAALRWYVGRIAFPLLIFKVVATSDVGGLQWYLIGACTLGKVVVMVVVGLLAFFCYHPHGTSGRQRVLTATCFAFFVVASDDFAVGFPVVQAIYSSDMGMDLYVAANALISNSVFVPTTMVIFEICKAMIDTKQAADQDSEDDSESEDCAESEGSESDRVVRPGGRTKASASSGKLEIVKRILLNPVILCIMVGAAYNQLFGSRIPELADNMIVKLTSPFGMMALFATGTVLKPPSLHLWPCMLSVFKVVVCAYVSFFAAGLLQLEHGDARSRSTVYRLNDFSFFYGSIPTSSAPLLFTVQCDPGSVDTVASATLFGLVLAGPVMLSTSIFLQGGMDDADTLTKMQEYISLCSCVFGLVFDVLLLLLVVRGRWGFGQRGKASLALYGFTASLYAVCTYLNAGADCPPRGVTCQPLDLFLVKWFGRACNWLLVLMQALTVPLSWMHRVPTWCEPAAICAIFVGALASALLFPSAERTNLKCNEHLEGRALIAKVVSSFVLLALLAGPGLLRLRLSTIEVTRSEHVRSDHAAGDDCGDCDQEWPSLLPKTVIRALVFLAAVQLLAALVDSSMQLAGFKLRGSFASMLLMEGLTEHAKSGILAVTLLFNRSFCNEVKLLWDEAGEWFRMLPDHTDNWGKDRPL